MPTYRVFEVDRFGRAVAQPRIIATDNDEMAFDDVRSFIGNYDVELWEGARFVTKISPPSAATKTQAE